MASSQESFEAGKQLPDGNEQPWESSGRISCPYVGCLLRFETVAALEDHKLRDYHGSQRQALKCPLCLEGKYFPREDILKRHMRSVHLVASAEVEAMILGAVLARETVMNTQQFAPSAMSDGGYTCTYHGCTLRFDTPAKLQKHKREGHRAQPNSSTGDAALQGSGQSGPYRCERINPSTGKPCNTIFWRLYDLTRHEDTIHSSRKTKFRCPLCAGRRPFSRVDALRHMRRIHPGVDVKYIVEADFHVDENGAEAESTKASAAADSALEAPAPAQTSYASGNTSTAHSLSPVPLSFPCLRCSKTFEDQMALRLHMADDTCQPNETRSNVHGDELYNMQAFLSYAATQCYRGNTTSLSFSAHLERRQSGLQSPSSMSPARMSPGRGSPMSVVSDGAATPPPIPFSIESPPMNSHNPASSEYIVSHSSSYRYVPLKKDQFRLLLLQHGEPDAEFILRVDTISALELQEGKYAYYALSYAWGPKQSSATVKLWHPEASDDTGKTGHLMMLGEMPVRTNLQAALRQLRSRTEDLWIWVDSLCIDQTSDEEKSLQLPHILQIYNNALGVCIWLGESEMVAEDKDPAAQEPLDFIPFILNLRFMDRWMHDTEPDESTLHSFVAFARLLRQPWFTRRWVIQEVSACRQASVHYADKKINWLDFVDAVQLFLAHIAQIRTIFVHSRLYAKLPDAFAHIESTGAVALVNAASNLLRKDAKGNIIARLLDLQTLVSTFVHFETTDPRDVIYALLPLASDAEAEEKSGIEADLILVPDYSRCAHTLYVRFIEQVIRRSGSLDIMCRHWAPNMKLGECVGPATSDMVPPSRCYGTFLPSWIGLATNSSFGPPSGMTGRLNGDSLIGDVGQPHYTASLKSHVQFEIEPAAFGSQPTLILKGFVLGQVLRVSARVVDGIISAECLHIAGWDHTTDVNKIPDQLWRTLVADRTSTGKKAPSWWRRACMHCLSKHTNGDLRTSQLMNNHSLPKIVREDFLRRVQEVVWNRKFFICTDLGSGEETLCLGPRDVDSNDLVCILFGCSVPVVIRNIPSHERQECTLVGECFVYEKMDGEAIAAQSSAMLQARTKTFYIR